MIHDNSIVVTFFAQTQNDRKCNKNALHKQNPMLQSRTGNKRAVQVCLNGRPAPHCFGARRRGRPDAAAWQRVHTRTRMEASIQSRLGGDGDASHWLLCREAPRRAHRAFCTAVRWLLMLDAKQTLLIYVFFRPTILNCLWEDALCFTRIILDIIRREINVPGHFSLRWDDNVFYEFIEER